MSLRLNIDSISEKMLLPFQVVVLDRLHPVSQSQKITDCDCPVVFCDAVSQLKIVLEYQGNYDKRLIDFALQNIDENIYVVTKRFLEFYFDNCSEELRFG